MVNSFAYVAVWSEGTNAISVLQGCVQAASKTSWSFGWSSSPSTSQGEHALLLISFLSKHKTGKKNWHALMMIFIRVCGVFFFCSSETNDYSITNWGNIKYRYTYWYLPDIWVMWGRSGTYIMSVDHVVHDGSLWWIV